MQEEYLHNTYNSMPNITEQLDAIITDEEIQWNLYNNSRAEVTRNEPISPNKTMAVQQFEAMYMYTSALRKILVEMADNIKVFNSCIHTFFSVSHFSIIESNCSHEPAEVNMLSFDLMQKFDAQIFFAVFF